MARTTSVRRVEGTHPTLSLLNRGARREGKLQDAEVVSLNHTPRADGPGAMRREPFAGLPLQRHYQDHQAGLGAHSLSVRHPVPTHFKVSLLLGWYRPCLQVPSPPPSGSRLALLNVTVVRPFAWPPWSLMQMKYKDNVPLHFWNPSPVALVSLCWTLSCIPPSTPP